MTRNAKILAGIAAASLATFLIRKYTGNRSSQSPSENSSSASRPSKHMTDVFSNAKEVGTRAMA